MSLMEILILALALSADAFSVGAAVGIQHNQPRQIFRLAWHFGLFQSLLPLAGVFTGKFLLKYVQIFDHWIAFLLLLFIGVRMICNSFHSESGLPVKDMTKGISLVGLSLAVSIDAFAAGITLAALQAPLVLSVIIIGVVAMAATVIAMIFSKTINLWIGKKSELLAGVILIALGIRILWTG